MTIRNENGWILATSKDGLEIWSFTLIGHYAHPSFARRKAAQKGDEWLMQTEMQCGATKPLCDRLIGEYRDLDRRMKEDTDARQRK